MICLKFHVKLWFLKDKKVRQPGKKLILGKKPETLLKVLLELEKKFISLMCYFWVYMMHHSCLYDSSKAACFVKISFTSYRRKCS